MGVGMVYFHFPFSTHAPVLKRQGHLCYELEELARRDLTAACDPALENFFGKRT